MGLCGSGGGGVEVADPQISRRSTQCLKKINAAYNDAEDKKKMLLLGAGESGKSTIFKQMRIINASGYSNDELKQFRWIIHRNVIDGIKILIEAAQERSLDLNEANEDIADAMLLYSGENVSPEVGRKCAHSNA